MGGRQEEQVEGYNWVEKWMEEWKGQRRNGRMHLVDTPL